MEFNSNSARLALAAVILLLAATGGITLANMSSLNNLEQQLGSLFSQNGAATQSGGIASPSPAAADGDTTTSGGEAEDPQPTATLTPHPLQIVFPGANDTLVLSSKYAEAVIALRASQKAENVQVQLTLTHRIESDNQKSILNSGSFEVYVSTYTNETQGAIIEAEKELSIPLKFSAANLPPSGKYEAYLQITSKDFVPLARQVSVVVVRPTYGLQSRAFQAPDAEKMIVISGVRSFYDWLAQLCGKPAAIEWNPYTLRIWEPDLISAPWVRIIPSELVDLSSGRSGLLTGTDETNNSGSDVITLAPAGAAPSLDAASGYLVSLKPSSEVKFPGAYTGVVNFVLPGGALQQSIPVKVLLRDSLWMPFWVILSGVLASGLAFRLVLGDVSKNMAYQLHLIQQAEDELVETRAFPHNPSCEDIKDLLVNAKAALYWNDFSRAAADLKNATDKLELLKEVESLLAQVNSIPDNEEDPNVIQAQTAYQEGDLANAKLFLGKYQESIKTTLETDEEGEGVARIAVRTAKGSYFFPADATFMLIKPAGSSFRLYDSSADTSTPQKDDLVGNVNWSIARPGFPFEPRQGGATLALTFTQLGKFVLKGKAEKEGKEGTLEIRVVEDVTITALRKQAFRSSLIWSVIATVAGLLYIESRIPTFGSPQDYLLALGWALGLGAASKPTESLLAAVLKALTGGKEPAPSAGEQQTETIQAPTESEQPEPKGAGDKKVPELGDTLTRKEVEEILKQAGLALQPDPANADEDSKIVPGSVDPEPGEPVGEDKKVKVKFSKTGSESTGEDDGDPGVP